MFERNNFPEPSPDVEVVRLHFKDTARYSFLTRLDASGTGERQWVSSCEGDVSSWATAMSDFIDIEWIEDVAHTY